MKVSLFLSSLWLFLASLFSSDTNTFLAGTVTDGSEVLIGATVKVMKGTDFIRGSITDYNGEYRIQLDPGTYDVEYSYTGFQTKRINGVRVLAGQLTTQDVVLSNSNVLNEVEILSYKVPLIEQDKTSSGQTLTTEQIEKLPTRSVNTINATSVGASSTDGGAVNIKGARDNGTNTYVDGIRVTGGTPPVPDPVQLEVITKALKEAPAAKAEKPVGMAKAPKSSERKAEPTRPSTLKRGDESKDIHESDLNPYRGNVFETKTLDPETGVSVKKSDDGRLEKPADASPPADDIIIVDGRKKRVMIDFASETYEEKVILVDVEDGDVAETAPAEFMDEKGETSSPAQPAPRAGLLTAGEWNDLHNWNKHWVDILADGETEGYQNMYGFFPRNRYVVMLTNENDIPVADAAVQLKSADDKLLWEARTDNTGKAELWEGLNSAAMETGKLRVEVWLNGKKQDIPNPKVAAEGFNYLKINAECKAPKNVDIIWAVDATGSMGDEIEYLKTELLDVIGRAKSRNPELAYRMGAVFYRDAGDEYVTRTSGFSSDIAQTVGFIQKQYAGGGGDYPEAVHSALEEAIFKQKWSDNAIARICFLVLDASPHQDPAVIASLQKSIREAARLGIRIVPIAASGVQKDTEFLMKFFGLATNGTYVFLTDHSGIGGKHLEPTTDEYKVEPLNDLLVRIITEYSSIETCEGKSEIRFDPDIASDPQQQPGPAMQALYYPNPAVQQFTLELPFDVQSVTIYNSEGQAVRKLEKPRTGAHIIQVNDLAAGFYTIRILNNGSMQSGKLMVVRS